MTLSSCNKKCCDSDLCNGPSNDETMPANQVPSTVGSDDIHIVNQTAVETEQGMCSTFQLI